MQKPIIIIAFLVVFAVVSAGATLIVMGRNPPAPASPPIARKGAADYKNATYLIEEKPVTLADGRAEIAIAPNSESKETTAVFGEPIFKDLDGDKDADVLLLLTRDSGGSGTFYYAAVAVNNNDSYIGTNAIFLGDRIATQTLGVQDGRAVVNYAARAEGESFAARPSIGKSLRITLDAERARISELTVDPPAKKPAAKSSEEMLEPAKMVKVIAPVKNQKITSPLKVAGQARGNWYFEASFPIAIIDADGVQLGVDVARAKSVAGALGGAGWMTTEFVPFEGTISFVKSATTTGILLVKKSNPSGLSGGDASISIPVKF